MSCSVALIINFVRWPITFSLQSLLYLVYLLGKLPYNLPHKAVFIGKLLRRNDSDVPFPTHWEQIINGLYNMLTRDAILSSQSRMEERLRIDSCNILNL